MAEGLPLTIVDLDQEGAAGAPPELGPFPLIGIGKARPPWSALLDAIVEPPAGADQVVRAIRAHPFAAQVLVQLLRAIEPLDIPNALVAESIAYGLLQGSEDHRQWIEARPTQAAAPPGRIIMRRTGDDLGITIDRPQAHNAIDREMRDGLREAFELAALDDSIERVTLRGNGRSFSVGAELAEFGTTRDPASAHAIRMQTLPAHAIARCRERLTVHVQGACVGSGLEMAAFARRITASRKAWFQLPELAMGIIPGAGGCVSVSRRIGRQRTALMVLSGRRIGVETALAWGLIDAILDS